MYLTPRFIILSISLLLMGTFVAAQAQSSSIQSSFDFRNGAQGWQAGVADYPAA